MTKISAVIITYNEEKNLKRCLESLEDLCDEILIVDSFSTDKTAQIAQSFNAIFIQRAFNGYGEQKDAAANLAAYDLILSLDADEALSPELLKSIREVKNNPSFNSYTMNRRNFYGGYWVKHCGWYPDRLIRLFDRRFGKWADVLIHESVQMLPGEKVGHLKGDIFHYPLNSMADHVDQVNEYTTIVARAAYASGKRSNLFKILTHSLYRFIKDYFLKLGFLDGRVGYTICKINALSIFLKYSKLKDLEQ